MPYITHKGVNNYSDHEKNNSIRENKLSSPIPLPSGYTPTVRFLSVSVYIIWYQYFVLFYIHKNGLILQI